MKRPVLAIFPLALLLVLTGCGPTLGDYMGNTSSLGICGMAILIGNLYALVNIVDSRIKTSNKVFWGLVVFFMPVLGFMLWYAFGPRQ